MSDTSPRGADRASRLARAAALSGRGRDVATQGRRLVYESGEWQIDLARRELRARGVPVPIGRPAALRELPDFLPAYRLVMLTGPGGIGKTRLVLEVARGLFPSFQGDVRLVELASLSDPGLVPSAVAGGLGLKLGGDQISAESVARAIGAQKLLLVLDNCEHVIDAAARLAETVIRMCPRTTILATSREILNGRSWAHAYDSFRQPGCSVDHVLAIVENQQKLLCSDRPSDGLGGYLVATGLQAEAPRHGGGPETRSRHRVQLRHPRVTLAPRKQ